MNDSHPNIALLAQVDISDIPGCADLFHADVVWRFFNPKLEALAGDHHGVDGIARFFARLAELTNASFAVEVKDAWPVGDELVVTQTRNRAEIDGAALAFDVVVVWRIVEGRISEVWDIPAVFTASVAR